MPKKENLERKVDSYYAARNAAVEALIRELGKLDHEQRVGLALAAGKQYAVHSTSSDGNQFAEALETLGSLAEHQPPEQYKAEKDSPQFFEMLAEFAQLEKLQKELEAQLKETAQRAQRLIGDGEDGPLIEAWIDGGFGSVGLKGRTFYVHTDRRLVRRKDADPKEALTALRRARLGALITQSPNSNSLKSWLKDREEQGKELPPGMARYYEVFERSSVRSRKA